MNIMEEASEHLQPKKKSNLKEGDISNFINFENKKNIYKLSFYKKFMENINYKKNKLKKQLSSLLKKVIQYLE